MTAKPHCAPTVSSLTAAGPATRLASGFTLIEVLLAITITGMIMVGLYVTLNTTLDTREMLQHDVRAARLGPALLDVIEEDLRRIWVSNLADDPLFEGDANTLLGESADSMSFVSTVDSTMTYRVGEREVAADLIETGYRLRPSPEIPDVLELWRRQAFHIDDEPLEDGLYQRMHDRVVAFEVRYYEDRVLSHEALEEWDSSERHALPAMISIEMGIEVGPRAPDEHVRSGRDDPRTRWYHRLVVLDPSATATMRVHPYPPSFAGVTSGSDPGGAAGANQHENSTEDPENPGGANPGEPFDLGALFGGGGG